jgi:PKD repeat protein
MMALLSYLNNVQRRFLLVGLSVFLSYNSVHAQLTANFTPDSVLCGSTTGYFAATVTGGSYSLSTLSFEWDFGDGNAPTIGQNISHVFNVLAGALNLVSNVEAPFPIKLTVYDKFSRAVLSTITKQVIVRPSPLPELGDVNNLLSPFNNCLTNPTVQNPTYTVHVSNQSQDISSIAGYKIDWGDGSPIQQLVNSDFLTFPSHTYTSLGLFKLKFTATGVNGCVASKTYDVKNQGNPGIGISSLGNTSGCAPVTFGFPITGIKNNDKQTTYVVDFGDGTIVNWAVNNDTTAYHTYLLGSCTKPTGYYTVKITATNACKSSEASFSPVRVGSKPIPSFQASNLCEDGPVNFQNTTMPGSNFDCSTSVVYKWNWGDGSPSDITSVYGVRTHVFPTTSNKYNITLVAVNNCKDSAYFTRQITLIKRPVAIATLSPLTGCKTLTAIAVNTSTGDSVSYAWRVSPTSGWTYGNNTGSTSKNPQFNFNTKGNYVVTLQVKNNCTINEQNFNVFINGSISVNFPNITKQCNTYTFNATNTSVFRVDTIANETVHADWLITPNSGYTFLDGTTSQSLHPKIRFDTLGNYTMRVILNNGCDIDTITKTFKFSNTPVAAATPSKTEDCIPFTIHFTNQSTGFEVVTTWPTTLPAGASYVNGTNANSLNPDIRFTQSGNYTIKLTATNACNSNTKNFSIKAKDTATITLNKINNICENGALTIDSSLLTVAPNNGGTISYAWSVLPNSGYTYQNSTNSTSNYPSYQFTTLNTYTISVRVTNDCGTTSSVSQSFTIDKFVQVEAGADTTLCAVNTLFALKGTPSGGSWSISPSSASAVLKLIGSSYYLDLSVPGNYILTYSRGNSNCFSQDVRHFTIIPLPVVDAGKDFTLCENDKNPYSLTGTPAGGTWSGSGVSGNTFSTNGLTAGSYILKYTWTDPTTTCSNTDQLVAKLLSVPITGFTMVVQGCKDSPVLFSPTGSAGTVYNWYFGDTQSAISSGTINHTYRTGGVFTVKMISADPNSCAITTLKNIVILDDITMPAITITPNRGCGPLTVSITADTTGTTGNGQSYSWNFGNGQTGNMPFITKDLTYNQGIKDTTYNIILTVSNNCFSKTTIYPVMVNALPHADFALPHPWECSPKIVSIKNLSQDRTASFHWYFGDGTTSTDYEPTHTFTTGKIATTYMIKLVAENKCGKDSLTRPLLIKPNSIEAFIQMNTRTACPGDVVTFTNFSTDTVQQIMNFYWDFGDGVIANTWNATHAYAAQGKYTIKLFVDNGCSYAEKTDTILIYPPLTLSITSRDSVCVGENIYLEGNSPLGTLINTKWDFGDSYFGTGSSTNHTFLTPGWTNVTFTASTATNLSHCSGLIVKRIYVKALPPAAPVNDITGCSPVVLNLLPAGVEPQLWNFGEDSVWTSSGKYTYHNDNPNNQTIRRKVSTVTENTMGCRSYSSFWVTIYPVPKAKIRLTSVPGLPENVFLTSLSTNTTACEWLFPDGSTAQECDSVLVKFYNNGFYKIQLRSSNQYGCVDTTSIVHETIIKGLFVPNAFKPSDQNPEVNTFKPVGIGLKSFFMGIYDIWDNLIWETTQLVDTKPSVGWDGNNTKGKNLPMGVYVWRMKAVFIDGTEWKGMKGRDGILRTEGTVTMVK